MTKKIVVVTSIYSVGCTFMDWSISYLNGRNNFFSVKNNRLENLVANPVNSLNSHGHKKNHPSGLDNTKLYVDNFLKSKFDLLTLYPYPLRHEYASELLGIAEEELSNPDVNQKVIDYQLNDYNLMCNYVQDIGGKLIFIDHDMPAFNTSVRDLKSAFRRNTPVKSAADHRDQLNSVYFSDSINTWKNLNLTEVWDQREQLALCTRPLNDLNSAKFNFSTPHFYLDSKEWLTVGTTTIRKIMDFCDLDIDDNKWGNWSNIYHQWQELHHNNLNFYYQLPHIIDSIVNNKFYKINLTFDQEIVVQHCLIYQHNLNLKTWQLTKFPNNTQDLHRLLEPNIHPLRDV